MKGAETSAQLTASPDVLAVATGPGKDQRISGLVFLSGDGFFDRVLRLVDRIARQSGRCVWRGGLDFYRRVGIEMVALRRGLSILLCGELGQ
mgnify:FL=1